MERTWHWLQEILECQIVFLNIGLKKILEYQIVFISKARNIKRSIENRNGIYAAKIFSGKKSDFTVNQFQEGQLSDLLTNQMANERVKNFIHAWL